MKIFRIISDLSPAIIMAVVAFAITLAMYSSPASASECSITPKQQWYLEYSYRYGGGTDYLGLTFAAIAMEESQLGMYKINLQDPSAGAWHATLDKGLTAAGWTESPFNLNRVAQRMIDDTEFAAEISFETLVWWYDVRKQNWSKAVASYNGGWRMNHEYTAKIRSNINKIIACDWLAKEWE